MNKQVTALPYNYVIAKQIKNASAHMYDLTYLENT